MNKIFIIPAMGDNYIYLYVYAEQRCFIVDPGQAMSALEVLEQNKIIPTHIMVTHNHYDHTAGIAELVNKYKCTVVTGEKTADTSEVKLVNDKDVFGLEDIKISVIGTPGHTAKSVCYYIEPYRQNPGALFTGDTMFVAGCGRIFGGSADIMYQSLKKLAALPDDTLVYPGHDYTEEDYRFALTIEPDNAYVRKALEDFRNCKSSTAHIPSTIGKEKQTNVFIRARDANTFARFRKQKDVF